MSVYACGLLCKPRAIYDTNSLTPEHKFIRSRTKEIFFQNFQRNYATNNLPIVSVIKFEKKYWAANLKLQLSNQQKRATIAVELAEKVGQANFKIRFLFIATSM